MFFISVKEINRLRKKINRLWKEVNKWLSKGMSNIFLTLSRMGIYWVVMNVGGKKVQNYINHVIHLLGSADHSIFSLETSNFCYIKKYRHKLHFNTWIKVLLNLFECLKILVINMIAIPMMWAKFTTLSLLKRELFWNKGDDVIIFIYDVTNKILSCD